MKGKIGDKARLLHIIDSINEIRSAVGGETKESFIKNHVLRIAVVKWIEIIGEAANHISPETKENAVSIEWSMIIGLRHIVVHEFLELIMTLYGILQLMKYRFWQKQLIH